MHRRIAVRERSPGPSGARQGGAALIEFALVLPLLVVFLVGTIYFGFVFVLQSAVTHAAQEGATAAVGLSPAGHTPGEYQTVIGTTVAQTVFQSLSWLPDSINGNTAPNTLICPAGGGAGTPTGNAAAVACSFSLAPDPNGNGQLLTVTVTVELAGRSSGLLPRLNLPPFGSIPPASLNRLIGVAEVTL